VKRSPLRRRTPLRGATDLKRSRLKPISDKRAERREADLLQLQREGKAFRDAIKGQRCIVCGRSESEAWAATWQGVEAHHAIPQQRLRRLGRKELLWAPQLALCVCVVCHAPHTSRKARIPRARLPEPLIAFCREHGLERELDLEYPV
jgi:hypothetical protein